MATVFTKDQDSVRSGGLALPLFMVSVLALIGACTSQPATQASTKSPFKPQIGLASWYGPGLHGARTASGEAFDQNQLTAAHPSWPLQSLAEVTNLENGRQIVVRVNDRGPFAKGRLVDLSRAAAQALGFEQKGEANVALRYLGPAPDTPAAAN